MKWLHPDQSYNCCPKGWHRFLGKAAEPAATVVAAVGILGSHACVCGELHADEAKEKELKFSLRASLHRAQQKLLLDGTEVVLSPGGSLAL